MANFQVTAVRLQGGESHQDITMVLGPECGEIAVRQVIDAIETRQHRFHVGGSLLGPLVLLHVVNGLHEGDPPYLRTRHNGAYTDHLLRLPRR